MVANQANSAKNMVERTKIEIPDFAGHYAKLEQQMTIGGYSHSVSVLVLEDILQVQHDNLLVKFVF